MGHAERTGACRSRERAPPAVCGARTTSRRRARRTRARSCKWTHSPGTLREALSTTPPNPPPALNPRRRRWPGRAHAAGSACPVAVSFSAVLPRPPPSLRVSSRPASFGHRRRCKRRDHGPTTRTLRMTTRTFRGMVRLGRGGSTTTLVLASADVSARRPCSRLRFRRRHPHRHPGARTSLALGAGPASRPRRRPPPRR